MTTLVFAELPREPRVCRSCMTRLLFSSGCLRTAQRSLFPTYPVLGHRIIGQSLPEFVFAKLRELCDVCYYLFMKGGRFIWPGRIHFVRRALLSRCCLMLPRPNEPHSVGYEVAPIPDEVRQKCGWLLLLVGGGWPARFCQPSPSPPRPF